ncbi:MAG: hypothetical protein ACYC64_11315 [Armatimonadota bacterium]
MSEAVVQVADCFGLGHFKKRLIGCSLPQTSFDPHGAWKNSYDIVFGGFGDDAHLLGSLSIERIPVDAESARFVVRYRKDALGGKQSFQGELQCVNNDLSTPINWESESVVYGQPGDVIADTRLKESGALHKGTMTVAGRRTTIAGPVAMCWGLMDAVQRLPRDKMLIKRFTLIDRLNSQVKPNQTLTLRDSISVDFGNVKADLHAYDHTGEGTLPTVYWVDDRCRLLFVTSGLIAYVYNADARV